MSYRIAGIDVHKKMLAVVVGDVAGPGEYVFERRRFPTGPEQLRELAEWLLAEGVQEVVMESTAQYWKPVWGALERYWQPACRPAAEVGSFAGKLHLAQAKSNRGQRGRKNDFADAERLVKRLVAQELTLSFVPDPEQRLQRTVTRKRQQLVEQKVRLQNQLECLLEEAHIKLSGLLSDLLGQSGRRMLQALAAGETDVSAIVALADRNLHATAAELSDALSVAGELNPVYRRLLKMVLEELRLLEEQMEQLDQEISNLLAAHRDTVQRLAEVPGLGVHSALQILAEVGVTAANFPSAKDFASWVGACPGDEVTAGVNHSSRSPKGNRWLRAVLNQAAHAAVKMKGSIFRVKFDRLRRGLDYQAAIWAIAHHLCRIIWIILHRGVRYEERGPAVSAKSARVRTTRMIRELRKCGYTVELTNPKQAPSPA